MRLLIFTPTWQEDHGVAMHPDCAESIQGQQIAGEVDWLVRWINRHPIGDHRNVVEHYQHAQRVFLAGPWDALLTMEHDNVLPDEHAVQRLLETPGDVVYAPYMLRHGNYQLSLWQYRRDRRLGDSLSFHPGELAAAQAANIWRVCGAGFGCTLFRRHVLAAIPFAPSPRQHCPDLPFAQTALDAGFLSLARLDVPVAHIDHDGYVWEPFQEIGRLPYLATATVVATVADGTRLRLVAGEWIELTKPQAKDLFTLGLVYVPDTRYRTELA